MNEQRREIEDEVTKRQLEVREQKEEQRLGENLRSKKRWALFAGSLVDLPR